MFVNEKSKRSVEPFLLCRIKRTTSCLRCSFGGQGLIDSGYSTGEETYWLRHVFQVAETQKNMISKENKWTEKQKYKLLTRVLKARAKVCHNVFLASFFGRLKREVSREVSWRLLSQLCKRVSSRFRYWVPQNEMIRDANHTSRHVSLPRVKCSNASTFRCSFFVQFHLGNLP